MPERPSPVARSYTPTALPPVTARLLAFVAIIVAGLCGGLVGYSIVDIQCGNGDEPPSAVTADESGCDTESGVGAVVGAVAAAGGVAVVAVLVLRAMAEWRRDVVPGASAVPLVPGSEAETTKPFGVVEGP